MIKTCPKTCIEKCEKTDFFLEHLDACKEIMEKDVREGSVKDDSSVCSEGIAQPMDCSNDAYIVDYPEECIEKCNKMGFYIKHTISCKQIMDDRKKEDTRNKTDSDDKATLLIPVSDSQSVSENPRLNACLESQRRIERGIPDDKSIQEFISTMPECAANTNALKGMYECLLEEAKVIKSSFGSLEKKGYMNVANPEVVCQYKKSQIKSDIAFARKVKQSATQLIEEFGIVNDCHNKYQEWLTAKESVSEGNPSESGRSNPVRSALTAKLTKNIQESLDPVKEQKSQVKNILNKVQENQKAIKTVLSFYYVIGCPQ